MDFIVFNSNLSITQNNEIYSFKFLWVTPHNKILTFLLTKYFLILTTDSIQRLYMGNLL